MILNNMFDVKSKLKWSFDHFKHSLYVQMAHKNVIYEINVMYEINAIFNYENTWHCDFVIGYNFFNLL